MKLSPKCIPTLVLMALGFFAAHAQELESTTPVAGKTNGEKWWNGNYERINTDLKNAGNKIDVCFVGDSITARWRGSENWTKHWETFNAVNMGIGGDNTQIVLWRLQNGQLDGYKVKVFVVMIGTNNLWGKQAKPEDQTSLNDLGFDEGASKFNSSKFADY